MNLTAILERMPRGQKQAGRYLLGFFALVLALTLISRGLDSYSVPTVTTARISSGAVGRRITIDGTIESLGQTAVTVPSGYLVESLLVDQGSRVQEGDLLAVLSVEALEERLAEVKREVEKAELNARLRGLQAQSADIDGEEKARLALERAREDLERAVEEGKEGIDRAGSDYADARRKRSEARNIYDDEDEYDIDSYKEAVTRTERALEDAKREAKEKELAARRAIEDGERALEEARLQKAADQSEDAVDRQKLSLEGQIASLEAASWREEAEKLEALLETRGQVTAPHDGVVTKLNGEAGSLTTGESFLLLSDGARGVVFRGEVEEKQGEHLSRGDTARLYLPGQWEPVTGQLSGLTPPTESGGDYKVSLLLPEADLEPGSSATMEVEKKSQSYSQIVPLAALHSKGSSTQSGYVFVLREKNTTLGLQTVVEQVDVQILDQNTEIAAIQGVFDAEDRIVTASSRALAAGDRVRPEAAE